MGNNLTDLNYQDHLSRLKYFGYNYVTGKQGMFNMGRNFGIKLIIPLGFEIKIWGIGIELFPNF